MFYQISFSEAAVRRRKRRMLARKGVATAMVALAYLLAGHTYVPQSMSLYALTREFSHYYLELLPRDIALSAALPVVDEFRWVGESCNQKHVEFLEALAADLTEVEAAVSGRITYSSDPPILKLEDGLLETSFAHVNAFFDAWNLQEANLGVQELSRNEIANDPLTDAYLNEKKTPLSVAAEEQVDFLKENMREFNTTLWQTEMDPLSERYPAFLKDERSPFFQIDPQMTMALLGAEPSTAVPQKEAAWKRLSARRFSFKRRLGDQMYERMCDLRELNNMIPVQQVTQPLFGQADWLLQTSTNFLTKAQLAEGQAKERILEVAGWAGFYKKPTVEVLDGKPAGRLFSLASFSIQSPESLARPFVQYVDFYKCLVNEPERFRVLSIPVLEIEIRDGAVFVNKFSIKGDVAAVDPEVLKEYRERMDEAIDCFDDLKKALEKPGLIAETGGLRRGR